MLEVKYNKKDNTMFIWFSREPVFFAEQTKNVIVHFSKSGQPVLMEVLEATDFLKKASLVLPGKVKREIFA